MKKLSIVGYASSYKEAPFLDDEFEIWIMNDMHDLVPRYDVLFDIHDPNEIKGRPVTRQKGLPQWETLKTIKKPIYMQKHFDEIPASIEFPLQRLIDKYHIPAMGDKLFVTCSVALLLAFAIDLGYEEIHLYGIDEAVDEEYSLEMPSVIYWLGYAAGKGIKIVVSPHSPLLKGWYVYGYEEPQKKHMVEFLKGESDRVKGIQQKAFENRDFYQQEQLKCEGALVLIEHINKLITKI
ncbi:MAG: hypothetical protein WC477_05965 [Patescibacteria group bacterium]